MSIYTEHLSGSLQTGKISGSLSNTSSNLTGNIYNTPSLQGTIVNIENQDDKELSGSLSNTGLRLAGQLNNTVSLKGDLNENNLPGTSNYNKLKNLPAINDVIISGNKTGTEYKLLDEDDYITSDQIRRLMLF